MPDSPPLSLAGQTLRWKFEGGPTGDNGYEHTFFPDGTVTYRMLGADATAGAKKEAPKKKSGVRYASFPVAPDMHLVSYLGDNGYTLTVLVDFKRARVHGFASSAKEWYPLAGELLPNE